MSANEAPSVTYRFVVTATIDGHSAPLSIEGTSINEIRRAVRLLDSHGLLTSQPTNNGKSERISKCRSCDAPVVWRETPSGKKCPYDVVDGQPTDTSHFQTCPQAKTWSKKGAA